MVVLNLFVDIVQLHIASVDEGIDVVLEAVIQVGVRDARTLIVQTLKDVVHGVCSVDYKQILVD